MDRWIPLTQYAIEEGVSISTLRRKIKSNSIEYRLDNGRYLIKSDEAAPAADTSAPEVFQNSSNDAGSRMATDSSGTPAMIVTSGKDHSAEIAKLSKDVRQSLAEMDLRWRALEARVNGLSKKVDFLIEQNSELNMLVKVFEEKLDASI